ncbi:MAG: TspO/MBR family protein [Acidobacteriota bacterium]
MPPVPSRSAPRQALALFAFLTLCLAAGGIGSFATISQIPTWYATLQKPAWTPPSWLFGPVWTTLDTMMGLASWLFWRMSPSPLSRPLLYFWLQLALNTLWSFLFFAWESPGLAFAEIILLWLAIAATIVAFRKLSPAASLLLLPYLGWVSFASLLNFAIWRLNR